MGSYSRTNIFPPGKIQYWLYEARPFAKQANFSQYLTWCFFNVSAYLVFSLPCMFILRNLK